jgi:hypothetical protein
MNLSTRHGGLCSQPVAASAPILSAHPRSLLYNLGIWIGQRRRNVFALLRQPRLQSHKVGAVFVNTPDT